MELKEVFTALETQENGADMIAVIKTELTKGRNEAKKNRLQYEGLLSALGIEDSEDAAESAKNLKTTLDSLNASGKKPDELVKGFSELTLKVETLEKERAAEKTKRIESVKMAKALAALQNGNAVDPETTSALILGKIKVNDDESVVFMDNDKEMSVDEGIKAFLASKPYLVKNAGNPGAGSGGGAGGSQLDYENMSMDDYANARLKELGGI